MPSTISAVSKFAADTFSTTTLSSVPTRNWTSTEAKIIEYSLFSDDDPRLLEFVFDALGSLKYYNKKFVSNKELCQIMIHTEMNIDSPCARTSWMVFIASSSVL